MFSFSDTELVVLVIVSSLLKIPRRTGARGKSCITICSKLLWVKFNGDSSLSEDCLFKIFWCLVLGSVVVLCWVNAVSDWLIIGAFWRTMIGRVGWSADDDRSITGLSKRQDEFMPGELPVLFIPLLVPFWSLSCAAPNGGGWFGLLYWS